LKYIRTLHFNLITAHFIFFSVCLLFSSFPVLAKEIGFTAERLEYLTKTGAYRADGSVSITFDGTTMHADKLRFNNSTYDAVADGNVVYEDSNAIIKADRLEINLKTKLGTVYNSYMFYKEHNIHLRSKKVNKIGDKSFFLDRATITTCDSDIPAWQISARDVTATQHENLHGKSGKFLINNTPVMYTPYFWAPLSQERQTGFLFPSFGYSSTRGYYYKQGFFWAIQENQDATLYLDYYSEKGPAQGLDYRYVLSPEIDGELWVYHVRDKRPDRDLYEVKSYHNHKLANGITGYLKLHAVNEFDYYETMDSTSTDRFGLSSWNKDPFGFASEERLQKYLESNLQVSKSFYGGRAYILAQGRQSLEGSSSQIPQSIPEAGLVLYLRGNRHLSFDVSARGTNFWRSVGQEGFRFDINPNIYISYGRLFNITHRIGIRETAYFLTEPSTYENRFIIDNNTSLSTRLYKKYARFIHVIEPSIAYEYVPHVSQENIPFFDAVDSISQARNFKYALTNRVSGLADENIEMRFRLSQSYSFLSVDENFTPLLAEADLTTDSFDLSMNASYNVHSGVLSETIASARFKSRNAFIGFGKNFRRSTSLDQYTIEAGVDSPITVFKRSLPFNLYGKMWYDANGGGIQELDVKTTYVHQCWKFAVNYIRKSHEYQVVFAVEFIGLGSFSLGSI
jgi:LPS-assembly protein